MSIFRVQKNANYTVMNRTALNDKRLSWKAKGIIAYMLSMPDDWTFYISELVTHSIDGEKAFRSGLKELKDCGYVQRVPVHENGKIKSWETIIHEIPLEPSLLADFVHVENVHVENVQVQKDALLSTEVKPITDTKLNTDDINAHFEQFWNIYPRKVDKKKAFKSFRTAIKNHSLETILSGAQKYAKQSEKTDKQYIKHPSTFLNNESFIDGYEDERSGSMFTPSAETLRKQEEGLFTEEERKRILALEEEMPF